MIITIDKIKYTINPIYGTMFSDIWQGNKLFKTILIIFPNNRKYCRNLIKTILKEGK